MRPVKPASIGLLAVLLFGLVSAPGPASAQKYPNVTPPPAKFLGQIASLMGPQNDPTGFTLQMRNRVVTMKVAPSATFKPLSAEAEVEGLVVGDYALVFARRAHREWYAVNITFDVQPLDFTRVTVTGAVVRESPDGKRFWMKLDSGEIRRVAINPKTTFHLDGQSVPGSMSLNKGDVVQVKMHRVAGQWIALDINVKSAQPY